MSADEISPTARALRALEVLQSRAEVKSADLALALGVSERAARRYVAILREAGIPVSSTRGPFGGYRLGRGVRLPPLVFTADDALGMVMAALDGQHAAGDPDDPVGAALNKLIRALPPAVARPAVEMRTHARAATGRDANRPDPALTSELVAAAANRRQVHLSYTSGSGTAWESDAEPWAVVVRYGRWYLLCLLRGAGTAAGAAVAEPSPASSPAAFHKAAGPQAIAASPGLNGVVRTLRVDRLTATRVLDETFEPPEDLDPVAVLEQHLATGWEYATEVVFGAPLDRVAPWIGAAMGRLESCDDGARCRLTGTTSNPAMYAGEWLAGMPFDFSVLGGPELRAATADVVRKLTAALG